MFNTQFSIYVLNLKIEECKLMRDQSHYSCFCADNKLVLILVKEVEYLGLTCELRQMI